MTLLSCLSSRPIGLSAVCSATVAQATLDWAGAEQLGGAFTVYSFGQSPYNRAAPFLTLDGRLRFSDGSKAFRRNRETAGPLSLADYNAPSCETCHLGNGRGLAHAASITETGFSVVSLMQRSSAPVFRYPITEGPHVARLTGVAWRVERTIVLPDGTAVELVAPLAIIDGEEQPADLRNAPGVYGLGLIEAIPDRAIRQLAESRPYAEHGIRGLVPASRTDGRGGRFGWKGTFSSLESQVHSAMVGELGIGDLKTPPTSTGLDELNTKLTNYMRLLAVPARRVTTEADHKPGAEIFAEIGCVMCHTPTWQTSNASDVPVELRGQLVHPFADFLLHDMGEGLRDSNNNELSRLWKTPPLWGIGMQASVSTKAGFLHDGRARNLLEAVLWHGGEAAETIHSFETLQTSERQELLGFLSSL